MFGVVCGCGRGICAPQLVQNRLSGSIAAPQAGQRTKPFKSSMRRLFSAMRICAWCSAYKRGRNSSGAWSPSFACNSAYFRPIKSSVLLQFRSSSAMALLHFAISDKFFVFLLRSSRKAMVVLLLYVRQCEKDMRKIDG